SRNEGDTPGRNDKGLVSYDRKTLKDSFYWYKANWSTSPVLYLTSRNYINRPTNTADIKIYSNLDAVTLSVNGVVVSTLTSTDHIFLWPGVKLAAGANNIQVTAKRNGTTYTDGVTWYAPMQLGGVPFARINFQPVGVAVPAAYMPDYGYAYGSRGNGFTYGWDSDNSANTFARGVMSDSRYDTGIAMEQPTGGHAWQIAVPNGTYAIHLVSGDPSNFDSIDEISTDGMLAVSGGVNVLSRFQEAWRTVTVTNGLLTITNATGSSNDKLDFIDINQLTVGGGQAASPSSGKRSVPLLMPASIGMTIASSDLTLAPSTSGALPQVMINSDGSMAGDTNQTEESNSTSLVSEVHAKPSPAILDASLDESRPVFDDKAGS
ncbi:MAG TPA: hypothetical protein VKU02_21365, partial [Gemmataceae bacterium]|nr:hypothetical protein [Gemmataceae bacterium]